MNSSAYRMIVCLCLDTSGLMGEGVNLALGLLEKRKQEYKDKGVDYYRPWLI